MMKQALRVAFGFLMLWAAVLHAEVRIEITQGVDSARPIGVVPFQWAGPGAAPAPPLRGPRLRCRAGPASGGAGRAVSAERADRGMGRRPHRAVAGQPDGKQPATAV